MFLNLIQQENHGYIIDRKIIISSDNYKDFKESTIHYLLYILRKDICVNNMQYCPVMYEDYKELLNTVINNAVTYQVDIISILNENSPYTIYISLNEGIPGLYTPKEILSSSNLSYIPSIGNNYETGILYKVFSIKEIYLRKIIKINELSGLII